MIIDTNNPMKLAHGIKEHYDSEKRPFVARPYNRFKPNETVWWVIPSKEWPAHRFAKFIIYKENKKMYIGINIEKGFGPVLLEAKLAPEKLIVKKDWEWNQFKQDLKNGKLNNVLLDSSKSIDRKIELHLAIGYVDRKQQNNKDYQEDFNNKIIYIYNDSKLDPINKNLYLEDETFDDLRNVNDIRELYNKISEKDLKFYWLDFNIVIPLDIRVNSKIDNGIDYYKLENKFLSKFDYLIEK